MTRKLTIVVRPFRTRAVMQALVDMEITSLIVREVKGYGRQKGYLERYVGSEYSMAFLPKVEIEVCVPARRMDEVIDQVVRAARTGRIGDGKIFSVPLAWPEIEF